MCCSGFERQHDNTYGPMLLEFKKIYLKLIASVPVITVMNLPSRLLGMTTFASLEILLYISLLLSMLPIRCGMGRDVVA